MVDRDANTRLPRDGIVVVVGRHNVVRVLAVHVRLHLVNLLDRVDVVIVVVTIR